MVFGLSGADTIKVKLESEKDCVQTFSVEIPYSKVKEEIEEAFVAIQNQAKLPGFRPGKTPLDLIKKTFKDSAFARAQDELLREGLADAMRAKNVKPVQTPVVKSVQFDSEKPFHFQFEVEVAPTFKLGSYKGLRLIKKSNPITEEDINKRLAEIAEVHAKLAESNASILEKSHFAIINYEGFLTGKPIPDSKAENFLIDLSAPQTITGLSEGLIGAKVGDEKDIQVRFPEDTPAKDYAGKDAIFKVKVIAIKEKKIPQLDDEFAKDLGMVSFGDLKDKVGQNLRKESEEKTRKELERQIIEKLLEDNKFSVPQSLIQKQVEILTDRQKYRMARRGVGQNDQTQILDGLKSEIRLQAEKDVRLAFILNTISNQEKIDVTDQEVDLKINEMVAQSPPNERPSLEKTLKTSYEDQIKSDLRDTKFFDFLIRVSKIKEISGGHE